MNNKKIAYFHLPGLFEHYEFYKVFLPLYYSHREYFYDWCDIESIYGSPRDSLWGGGRVECSDTGIDEVIELLNKYNISIRLAFSNLLLNEDHLSDYKCNNICKKINNKNNGIIISSDLLKDYIKINYSNLYLISSTTKVLTNYNELLNELNNDDYKYVVPDFRFNHSNKLLELNDEQKNKIELLVNECCSISCLDRRKCYESVSKKNLGIDDRFMCTNSLNGEGYKFSAAMKNKAFISKDDILNIYLPNGISNFKIEGRGLGSALLLEFILYYMTKQEYQLEVREAIYLDSMLDLF